jgi:hypothetical protein
MKDEKYFISVGEPWDFESPDGQNIVRGNILSIISNQCIVFKSNHALQFGNIKGNILVLTPRTHGNVFSELKSDLVVINGSILLKEYNEQLSENELKDNMKFVIIGSIRKE